MKSMSARISRAPELGNLPPMLGNSADRSGGAGVLGSLLRLGGGRLRLDRLALGKQGREVEVAIGHQLVGAGGKAGLFGRIVGGRGRDRLAIDGTVAAAH